MPNTVHLDLMLAMQAALGSLPDVPASHVHVELPTAVDEDDCPAVVISVAEGRFENLGTDGAAYDLVKAAVTIHVHIHTRGSPHTQVADPFIGQVHAALLADPSLGGRAARLRLASSRPDQAPAAGVAGKYALAYEVVAAVDERTLAIVTQ